jgi:phospholipase C
MSLPGPFVRIIVRRLSSLGLFGLAAALLGACASSQSAPSAAGGAPLTPFAKRLSLGSSNLPTHVVVILQENRSVDNLFQQLPGIDTQNYGLNKKGKKIALTAEPLAWPADPSHAHAAFVTEFDNGKLDGFAQEKCSPDCGTDGAYSYVEPSDVTQYYAMAEQYAFAEHNLQPNEGPSMPGHIYMIAAESGQPGSTWYLSENPKTAPKTAKNCLAPAGTTDGFINMTTAYPGVENATYASPCLNGTPTIIDEIASAGLTWKYYTPNIGNLWTAPCNISKYGCPNNPNVITPQTQVLTDIANGALANVSWVIPSAPDSDHPVSKGGGGGPAWVSSVVDAIGQSQYWQNTAIFVVWDDWGGWYDHYTNGNNHPASNPTDPYEYGFRVPLIAIGPYVRPGYISSTPRNSTSILHFIEDNFGLASLGYLDSQTDDLGELFNFAQNPNPFQPFDMGGMTLQERRMQPPDPRPVDSD